MFNKVLLIGVVEHPVTTKQINPTLQAGTLSLTVTRSFIKQGAPATETSIIDVELWGKLIDEAFKFDPGAMIMVEGRLRVRRSTNPRTGGESVFVSVMAEKLVNLIEKPINQQAIPNSELDVFKQNSVDMPTDLPF